MNQVRSVLFLLAFILAGCTSFHGLKPLYPDPGHPSSPKKVESLQPTFRWQASSTQGVTYDLIIYEGIKVSDWKGTKRSVGREVYYREGLTGTEHRMEEPLKPKSEYYWSIRARNGDKVTAWSLYDYTLFLGTAYVKATNQPFIFQTPDK